MEIINVESRTWEMMMARFEAFAQRVEILCRCTSDKALQKWLDKQLGAKHRITICYY